MTRCSFRVYNACLCARSAILSLGGVYSAALPYLRNSQSLLLIAQDLNSLAAKPSPLRFLILWEIKPEKVMDLVEMVKQEKIAIPDGYKTVTDLTTPDGTLWVETIEVDSYEKISKVVSQLLSVVERVRVHPVIDGNDFYTMFK